MENTKALEVARAVYKIIFDDTIGNVISDNLKEAAKRVVQPALDEATADLRNQLAERDAQLAAERAMADRLAVALSYIVNASVKEMQALDMTMTEIASQTPIMLAHDAYSAYEAHKATRQPTQDKGGE